LNPNCEIYVNGLYNIFEDLEPKSMAAEQYMEDQMLLNISELKKFYTKTCAVRNEFTYVDVVGTKTWDTYPMYTPFYYMAFAMQIHPSPEGHEYMARQYRKAINKNG